MDDLEVGDKVEVQPHDSEWTRYFPGKNIPGRVCTVEGWTGDRMWVHDKDYGCFLIEKQDVIKIL